MKSPLPHKYIALLLIVIFVSLPIFFKVLVYDNLTSAQRSYLVMGNPIGYRITANWHSLQKIANIVHLPYWLRETQLPTYHILISPKEYNEMDDAIPRADNGLSFGDLTDNAKHYVKANFYDKEMNYDDDIKIRLRGLKQNNRYSMKRAYRIKFPKNNYFKGQRALNLFLPYDRAYFSEPLVSYRAEKLGLFAAQFSFVRAHINGRNHGVYLSSEPWSKQLLSKRLMVDTNSIYTNKDGKLDHSPFSVKGITGWRDVITDEDPSLDARLITLLNLIENTDNETFYQLAPTLVDMEKVYAWQMLSLLSGSDHQDNLGNSVLLFRKETGLFEFIPWDVNMYPPSDYDLSKTNALAKRILNHPDFYDDLVKFIDDYVHDETQLEDDLQFYDDMAERMRPEFYADQAKLHTDQRFDKEVAQDRENIIDNFHATRDFIKNHTLSDPTPFEPLGVFSPGEGFERLADISISIEEFIEQNPLFKKIDEETLQLPRGTHTIKGTVIVPRALRLIIEAGVTLKFEDNASLISYSPVTAIGTEAAPIFFVDSTPDSGTPWGVFAVINTKDELNEFEYLRVNGGSATHLNGVFFTSQFSLHNAHSTVHESDFSECQSDDAFHAILGSVQISNSRFFDNPSDGIDVDYVSDSLITGSHFFNNIIPTDDGDAVDFSGVRRTRLEDSVIELYGDKCISAGENSILDVARVTLNECTIGLALKDNSHVNITDSFIQNNDIGVASYMKKPEFIVPGSATIIQTELINNDLELDLEDPSLITQE